MTNTTKTWIEREANARKHGRSVKPLAQPSKDDILAGILAANISEQEKIRIAYHQGYLAGQKSIPNPLYNEAGRQIREVTQSELDWSL